MEDETEHLALLLGRRKTEGWTKGTGGPPARIDAVDTYEWLPGGRALLHTVDTRVGDEKIEGAEIIGYDPARSRLPATAGRVDTPHRRWRQSGGPPHLPATRVIAAA
jgi:hypothetical protein